jgi:hypothetical protein
MSEIVDIVQVPQVTNWIACMDDGTYRWVLPGTRQPLPDGPTAEWMARHDGAHSTRWGTLPQSVPAAPTATAAQLQTLGTVARDAQARRDAAFAALRDATLAAIAEGMTEKRAAEMAGVDRMTVRRWQGKR